MSDFVLDSDVVIWHLRGRRGVVDLVTGLAVKGRLGLSVITRAEVLLGMRENERQPTLKFLDACKSLPVDHRIADKAAEMIRTKRSEGVTVALPDALIAATALALTAPLFTCNPRHYEFKALDVRIVPIT